MSEREAWLERLLVGELDPDSDEARGFFQRNPGAREELEAMHRLEGQIRRAGRERREVIDDALRDDALRAERAPGSERVGTDAERFVTERLAGEPPARGARGGDPLRLLRRAVPLAAAAALVLFLFGPWVTPPEPRAPDGPGPDRGPTMGGALELLPPVRTDAGPTELRWEYELEGAQYFRVVVYDPEEPFDPIASSPDLEANRWKLDSTEVARWPDPFEWRVQVRDDTGVVLEESARARRSR